MRRTRSDRVPREEGGEKVDQVWRRRQSLAGGLDVAVELDGRQRPLALAPQREGVAIGVDEVRDGLQLLPLILVVALEFGGVGALSRSLDLDEPDEGALAGDREVRSGHQIGEARFAHELNIESAQSAQRTQRLDEVDERRAELIFRFAHDGRVAQTRLGVGAEGRYGLGERNGHGVQGRERP